MGNNMKTFGPRNDDNRATKSTPTSIIFFQRVISDSLSNYYVQNARIFTFRHRVEPSTFEKGNDL